MAKIDVLTLVAVFEKRIEALEKNPPDKVPMAVIIKMLEKSIDEIIKDHFVHLIKKDIKELVTKELKDMRHKFVKTTVDNMLSDSSFREALEKKVKNSIIENIKYNSHGMIQK